MDQQAQIEFNDLRQMVLNNEELPAEQYAIVIEKLTEGRATSKPKEKKAKKEAKPDVNIDDFFKSNE